MNIFDMINVLAPLDPSQAGNDFCTNLIPVWTVLGYVIFGIKVVVPILLIISGMIDLAQAVMKQDEKDIKKAQSLLVKKLIAGVLVFLVVTIVSIVVGLVSSDEWEDCTKCAISPFKPEHECYVVKPQ